MNELESVAAKVKSIPTICVIQEDSLTNSIGVTFKYLDETYTTYIDVQTGNGELLKHDSENLTIVENIGMIQVEEIVDFFSNLPKLESIAK